MLLGASSAELNTPSRFIQIFGVQLNRGVYAPTLDNVVKDVRTNVHAGRTTMFIAENESHLGRLTEGFYDNAVAMPFKFEQSEDFTNRWKLEQTTAVCRSPSVKTMLTDVESPEIYPLAQSPRTSRVAVRIAAMGGPSEVENGRAYTAALVLLVGGEAIAVVDKEAK